MSHYEEPTNEFRQVKKPIKVCESLLGFPETVGYETTIQRKWRIYEDDLIDFVEASPPKEEWRNIPCVDDAKAP